MDFGQFLGNHTLKAQLSAAIDAQRLTHCYLLSGPKGSGKAYTGAAPHGRHGVHRRSAPLRALQPVPQGFAGHSPGYCRCGRHQSQDYPGGFNPPGLQRRVYPPQ